MKSKDWRRLAPLFSLALFIVALWVLRRAMSRYHYRDIVHDLREIAPYRILAALALTFLNYALLTFYDVLAFRYIGRALPYLKIALGSFLGYVFSMNVGLSAVGASAARYRVHSSWGVSAIETAKVVVFCGATFLIGFFTLAGVLLLVEPIPSFWSVPRLWVHALAVCFLALVAAYLLLAARGKKALRIRQWRLAVPSLRISLAQVGLSCLDWVLACSVLYVLLPTAAQHLSFLRLMTAFLLAEIAGLVSQVPGGLGVLEGVSFLLLVPPLPASSVLAALLLYRVIYYLLPFFIGVMLLALHEIMRRRVALKRVADLFGQTASFLIPWGLSITTFAAGALLLFSGALPPAGARMSWLDRFLPLPVIEVSHFLASVVGAGLLVVAWGLRRRLNTAYVLCCFLLGAGAVFSLAKGLGFEEAATLAAMLVSLVGCRQHFHRKAPLLDQKLSRGWVVAVAAVLLSSISLGLFSYQHVEYSGELWWRFALSAHAPRFLRASAAALSLVLLVGLVKVLRPVPPRPSAPGDVELEKARAALARARDTTANLALLGDKTFLFSRSGSAFIMYAVQGRSWVAMGDPVGDAEESRELVWQFHELSDRYDGWTVFYEVGEDNLPFYLDIGLTLLKLGEQARVPLDAFSLDAPGAKGLRQSHRKGSNEGWRVEVVEPAAASVLLKDLRRVSDAWLASKNTREKGFSLGYFDERYLTTFPMAILRKDNNILAFANIWEGAEKEELSMDLMRYVPGSAHGLMDYMLVELMAWGKEKGYQWFNLGMAPLSGLEARQAAPLWHRLGSFAFRRGGHFYSFEGLRRYKQKFDPVWSSRFLASPGGLKLPHIFANLVTLISRGPAGIPRK